MFYRNILIITSIIIISSLGALTACTKEQNDGPTYVKKDSSNSTAVAKVFGKEISFEELEKTNPDVFNARQELYQAQKQALDEYIREATLERLAQKDSLSVKDFTEKQMEKAKKAIKDKEVMAFLKERNVRDPENIPANIKDQIRGMIFIQNLVNNETKSNPIELYLKRPQAPNLEFSLKGEASQGKEDAPVTIVEFSDFQCPFCARGKSHLQELRKIYGDKVRVVFKHFPLPMHPDARPASEAAMCVHEQSSDKFWKYHDMLFDNQQKLSESDLTSYAKKVGADMKKFEDCFKEKKYASLIDATLEEGRKFGVNSTPSFYINGYPIRGARDISEFKEVIDDILAKK